MNNYYFIIVLDRATTHYDDTLTYKLLKKKCKKCINTARFNEVYTTS